MKSYFSSDRCKYFELGILFSSLDSFHGLTKIATYAPFISIAFFLIYYIKTPYKYPSKFSQLGTFIFFIILISILYSFYVGLSLNDYKGFINYLIQLLLAIICFCSFSSFFKEVSIKNPSGYITLFSNLFIKYSIPVLIIGCIEICLLWNGSLYGTFVSIFSSRIDIGRIQLISAEPAWATRLLLTLLCLIPLSSVTRSRKRSLTITCLILLFATGSSYGYICVLIYYILTYLKRRYYKYIVLGILFFIAGIPILINYTSEYTKARIELLTQLNTSDVETLAIEAGSISVMARIGNPIIGVDMGIANPLFGVGGGYYYAYYKEFLSDRYPNAAVRFDGAIELAGATAKNLFARIIGEFGIILFILIIVLLISQYKEKIRYCKRLKGPFIAMIILTFNFDSLYHIYPLLLFSFIYCVPQFKTSYNGITIKSTYNSSSNV